MKTVRISVVGGVAFVDQVPPGVTVEVTDYDVESNSPERDDHGHPCSRYRVEAERPALELVGAA